jgi:hypothetical protein
MLMTVPQVLTILGRSPGRWRLNPIVERLSPLGGPVVWHGLRRGGRNIYLPCIGWAGLDVAVIRGAILYG